MTWLCRPLGEEHWGSTSTAPYPIIGWGFLAYLNLYVQNITTINGALVKIADIPAGDSVIHLVSSVLPSTPSTTITDIINTEERCLLWSALFLFLSQVFNVEGSPGKSWTSRCPGRGGALHSLCTNQWSICSGNGHQSDNILESCGWHYETIKFISASNTSHKTLDQYHELRYQSLTLISWHISKV